MSQTNVEKRLIELRELAAVYAKNRGEQVRLEEFRKSKRAILFQQAPCDTIAAKEAWAYAHEEYIAVCDALAIATENAEKARWELKIAEWGVDLWRTKQANERAERKGYGV